jgi:hypothetical protein
MHTITASTRTTSEENDNRARDYGMSFKFETPEDPDFKACWALSNLRPLWSTDNIRKSDKRTHLL